MTDYYKILNVNFGASEAEIKKRFRELATIHHPDKNAGSKKSEEIFKVILNAYEILSDKEKRAIYNFKYKEYFNHCTTENNQNYSKPKTETSQEQKQPQTQYKESVSKHASKLKINYGFWLLLAIVVILYFYSTNKKTTTGNPKADELLEQQKSENRPQSGELDFKK